jgi:hypothetical protein
MAALHLPLEGKYFVERSKVPTQILHEWKKNLPELNKAFTQYSRQVSYV